MTDKTMQALCVEGRQEGRGRSLLLDLAAQCKAAVKPDNVLNRATARAVGWGYLTPSEAGRKSPAWFHPDDCRDGKPVLDSLHGTDVWREPAQYVFSLDAAMTLVPEGWFTELEQHSSSWTATLADKLWFDDTRLVRDASAATPALALCAAALRARAAPPNEPQTGEAGHG